MKKLLTFALAMGILCFEMLSAASGLRRRNVGGSSASYHRIEEIEDTAVEVTTGDPDAETDATGYGEHKMPAVPGTSVQVVTQKSMHPEVAALLRAVTDGDLATVQRLHAEYPGILQTRFSGAFDGLPREKNGSPVRLNKHSLLHIAAHYGQIKVVELLLERGALVDAQDKNKCTPLHLAAQVGHTEVVRLLLERGALVDAQEANQWTPLHLAAHFGETKVVELLLERGALVDVQEEHQWTPLHIAAWKGHTEVAELLLNHGASIELQNGDHNTALQTAVRYGHPGCAEYLLKQLTDNEAHRHIKTQSFHADGSSDTRVAQAIMDEVVAQERTRRSCSIQ